MWVPNANGSSVQGGGSTATNGLVAVAVDDKVKGSQQALKWATENLVSKDTVGSNPGANNDLVGGGKISHKKVIETHTKELLHAYHCLCMRKDVHCFDVVLEDSDVARAITEYIAHAAIENLVLGPSHHGFIKFKKMIDVPTNVSKGVPDFCTVYVISKSKISSVRNARRKAPFISPLLAQIQQAQEKSSKKNNNALPSEPLPKHTPGARDGAERTQHKAAVDDTDLNKSLFTKGRGFAGKFGHPPEFDCDITFVSSGRPTAGGISTDRLSGVPIDSVDSSRASSQSVSSDSSFGSNLPSTRESEFSNSSDVSSSSLESDDVEAEMRRLKLELQRTLEMYSTARKEALTSKQKAVELNQWRMEEERRQEEARLAEESARLTVEQEKANFKSAIQTSQASKALAESEDDDERSLGLKYRRYTIDEIDQATDHFAASRKIGEGGYGPVLKCYLDHTRVAVKLLRPDAAKGREQFHREVAVLSCLRHPNMVLLLGACPEYGCLVYEYMANGSLEDCLMRNTRALSWQLRFRIAAEIATCLHFLHQTKPEPLVHRDLKPANILLDQNYVSKISDVGLSRLVPPSVADNVTQYRMTSAAGTFCYIDPEYQQTGMLGVKSDVYSFGVVLLQIVTGKPAIGLTHHVARAVENGKFAEMLDPAVPDWPVEEALAFANMALRCVELRRKDRPDLGKVVLPELNRLMDFGEENMGPLLVLNNVDRTQNL